MEEIKLSAKHKKFKDINEIEPDYIEKVLFKMKEVIGFSVLTLAKSEKSFDEEPLVALKSLIEYNENEFTIALERTTYDNIFLLNVNISVDEEKGFFTLLYDLKIAIMVFLKKYLGNVYYIQDTSNKKICIDLYKRVHSIENDFRQLITIFYTRKLGSYDLTKKLENNASEYSEWYNSNYKNSPFKNIESPLFHIMTDKLFDALKRPMFELNSSEKKRLTESVDKLNELLEDLTWTTEFTISTTKLNDFKKKYEDEFKIYKKKSVFELYFKDTLGEDFETKWLEFAKMRNMVAHNKPICKELYNNILEACRVISERIENAKESLDSFIPDEVSVVDALYEHQREVLDAEADELDYQREMSGIDPVWDEDTVIEMLGETKDIENLITILDGYGSVKSLMEEYDEIYYKIDEKVSELDIDTANDLRKKIEEELDTEIEVEDYPDEDDVLHDTKAGIMDAIRNKILDNENVYSNIDDSKYLDYFSMDEDLADFKDLIGNRYRVYMYGTINPDHNYEEDIEIRLMKNNDVLKRGYININYGGFDGYDYYENQADNPYEADITLRLDEFNDEVESVILGIIASLESKFEKLKRVELMIKDLSSDA